MDLIPHPSNGEMGAILEVFNALGESISVVTFGVVGFRLNNQIEPFSTQYCVAQPNLQ